MLTCWPKICSADAAKQAAGPPRESNAQAWTRRYLAACASPLAGDKVDFLSDFNEQAAPLLTHELAMQEWLNTKTLYLHLPVGSRLRCRVETDYRSRPTNRYAQEYVLAKRFALRGCKAYLWVPSPGLLTYCNPHLPGQNQADKVSMMTFQGTCAEQDPREEAWDVGTGMHTDLDGFIGESDFEEAKPELLKWVRMLEHLGAHVVLAGHSLGGVMACRLAAELTEAQKRRTLLFTVGAPLLDDATTRRAEKGLTMVHEIVDHDPCTKVGGRRRCQGMVIKARGETRWISLRNHVSTPLGDAMLNGRAPKYRKRKPKADDVNMFLEGVRRVAHYLQPWAHH